MTLASVSAVGKETFRKTTFPEFPLSTVPPSLGPHLGAPSKLEHFWLLGESLTDPQFWSDSGKVTPTALSSAK